MSFLVFITMGNCPSRTLTNCAKCVWKTLQTAGYARCFWKLFICCRCALERPDNYWTNTSVGTRLFSLKSFLPNYMNNEMSSVYSNSYSHTVNVRVSAINFSFKSHFCQRGVTLIPQLKLFICVSLLATLVLSSFQPLKWSLMKDILVENCFLFFR